MSKFQSVVSTIAALSTIAVTSVTAYKVFENQQLNNQNKQIVIEDLKQQLKAKNQQLITPTDPVLPLPATPPAPVLPPVAPPAAILEKPTQVVRTPPPVAPVLEQPAPATQVVQLPPPPSLPEPQTKP
jgi:hypothetical protein